MNKLCSDKEVRRMPRERVIHLNELLDAIEESRQEKPGATPDRRGRRRR